MAAKTQIDDLIRNWQETVARLEKELLRLQGEQTGFLQAIDVMQSADAQPEPKVILELQSRINLSSRRLNSVVSELETLRGKVQGLRSAREVAYGYDGIPENILFDSAEKPDISPSWRQILGYILRRSPNPTSIDEIMSYIQHNNLRINRNAVRSQLHLYAQRRFLKRVSDGLYIATDAIKRIC